MGLPKEKDFCSVMFSQFSTIGKVKILYFTQNVKVKWDVCPQVQGWKFNLFRIPHPNPNPSMYWWKQDTYSHEVLRYAVFSIRAHVTWYNPPCCVNNHKSGGLPILWVNKHSLAVTVTDFHRVQDGFQGQTQLPHLHPPKNCNWRRKAERKLQCW